MSFAPAVCDEAAAVLRSLVGPVRAEPGCIATRLLKSTEEASNLTWMEEWRDIKEFELHLKGNTFRKILAVIELAAAKPEVEIDDIATRRGFDLVEEVFDNTLSVYSISETNSKEREMSDEKMEKITVENTRNMRYGEFFIIKPDGLQVYNTTGLNDCPAELWDALDLDEIKQQTGAMQVQLNGPHFWMMDRQTLALGEKAIFGGIEARWAAHAPLSVVQKGASGGAPYQIYTPSKTQSMVYDAGKPVFELIDPDGYAYVLQAREERFPIPELEKLGDKLNLPEGWRYRSRVLNEDLALDLSPAGTIYAVGDDFHQYYTRHGRA